MLADDDSLVQAPRRAAPAQARTRNSRQRRATITPSDRRTGSGGSAACRAAAGKVQPPVARAQLGQGGIDLGKPRTAGRRGCRRFSGTGTVPTSGSTISRNLAGCAVATSTQAVRALLVRQRVHRLPRRWPCAGTRSRRRRSVVGADARRMAASSIDEALTCPPHSASPGNSASSRSMLLGLPTSMAEASVGDAGARRAARRSRGSPAPCDWHCAPARCDRWEGPCAAPRRRRPHCRGCRWG